MQIFQGVQISRPVPFDRNGVTRSGFYNVASPGPISGTLALTYTVPAGKRGYLEVLTAIVQRQAAAAPNGSESLFWQYTPSGGSAVTLQYAIIQDNTPGATSNPALSQFGFMAAGDSIKLFIASSSTGGQALFNGSYKLMEFDP